MTQIVSLGKHPFVERQPRELAIDKACWGMKIDRRGLDRLGAGAHYRSLDGAGGNRFDAESIFRVKECHVLRLVRMIGSHAVEHDAPMRPGWGLR
jgi:hypothetical protein